MNALREFCTSLLALLALTPAAVLATGPFPGVPQPAPSASTPVTISGRVVTEDGRPLAGVQFWMVPQTEGSGIGAAVPVSKPFAGIPSTCFPRGATGGAIVTDGEGRYRFTTQFYPNAEINFQGDKCSSLIGRMTAANVSVVPAFTQPLAQRYDFHRATGPLPGAAVRDLPRIQANPETSRKVPPGFAPQAPGR